MMTILYTNTDVCYYMFAPFPPTKVKVQLKFHPRTGDEGPDGD